MRVNLAIVKEMKNSMRTSIPPHLSIDIIQGCQVIDHRLAAAAHAIAYYGKQKDTERRRKLSAVVGNDLQLIVIGAPQLLAFLQGRYEQPRCT